MSGTPGLPPLVTISPYSMEAIGQQVLSCAGQGINAHASALWPSADLALFYPFVISQRCIAVLLWAYNGGTAAGSTDIGIYTEDGTRLVSIGPTAQAGTNVRQSFNITDTELFPGRYYMALASSSGAATFFRSTMGDTNRNRTLGMFQQASAGTLPATATFAAVGQDYLPIFGLTTRSVL